MYSIDKLIHAHKHILQYQYIFNHSCQDFDIKKECLKLLLSLSKDKKHTLIVFLHFIGKKGKLYKNQQ